MGPNQQIITVTRSLDCGLKYLLYCPGQCCSCCAKGRGTRTGNHQLGNDRGLGCLLDAVSVRSRITRKGEGFFQGGSEHVQHRCFQDGLSYSFCVAWQPNR